MAIKVWEFTNSSTFVVPHEGLYRIEARGAEGGEGGEILRLAGGRAPIPGQRGSIYSGEIELTEETLSIRPGRMGGAGGPSGATGGNSGGGGGGGSTSVYNAINQLIIQARGGNGGNGQRGPYSGASGSGASGGSPDGERGTAATISTGGSGGQGGGSNRSDIGLKNTSSSVSNQGHGTVTISLIKSPPFQPSDISFSTRFTLEKETILDIEPNKERLISGEEMYVSWTETADPEDLEIWYELEWFNGIEWLSIIDKYQETSILFKIPTETQMTHQAQLRIRAYNEYYRSAWKYSDVTSIYQYLFLINENNNYHTIIDQEWKTINIDHIDKSLYVYYGIDDLSKLEKDALDRIQDDINIVSFSNSMEAPQLDMNVQEYQPLFYLNSPSIVSRQQNSDEIYLKTTPHMQLITGSKNIRIDVFSMIDTIQEMLIDISGEGNYLHKFIISSDGGNHYWTYINEKWTRAEKNKIWISEYGMDHNDLKMITDESWDQFFGKSVYEGNMILRISHILDVKDDNSSISIHNLKMKTNNTHSWDKAKKESYLYQYPDISNDIFIVTFYKDGTYKINY